MVPIGVNYHITSEALKFSVLTQSERRGGGFLTKRFSVVHR
jgi:hypothetical protein